MRLYVSLLILINWTTISFAQTCCSGGVPLASNLGMPASEKGTIQLALSYDLNVLETLKTGKETLEDDSRSRKTHASLLELGYAFSNKFSVDAFFSFIRQEREIRQFGNRNFSATNGIGDAVLLFKYKVWATSNNNSTFQIGIGPKIPLGSTTKTNEIGLALNADLQPGSGAWDGIVLGQFTHVLNSRPSSSFLATATYSIKGKNEDYFDVQTYQFGNEFQFSMGFSDRILLGNNILDPSLLLRFRTQQADRIDAENLPSTGGNWFFLHPAISLWLSPNFSLNTSITLPLFSNIVGTQVTPTYRFSFGVYYKIPSKKESFNF